MEYDNISKSMLLGTLVYWKSFGNKRSSSNKFGKCSIQYPVLGDLQCMLAYQRFWTMFLKITLDNTHIYIFFSLLPSYMNIVNIGSWLRISMNGLSILLLNSLKIFISLYTYLLK